MSAGRYVRAPSVDSVNHYEELEDEYLDDIDSGTVGATEEVEFQEFDDTVNKDDLPMKGKAREPEIGWHYTEAQPTSMQLGNCSYAGGRLDNPPQFPKNVPTSRLQEEWNRFLQKFEIAASLSKISDPAQLAKHLFMCMGDQLQDIVCIAKLRPGLNDPRCYRTMVDNINAHLRKLTDPITEHEMFSRMSQGQDETLDGFLVRLKSKVRLCEYSDQDEDRFVYTQLLKGMRDKRLAEDARIYGYDISVIIKAAARKEAFTLNTMPNINSEIGTEVLAVSRKPDQGTRSFRKRTGNPVLPPRPGKMQRYGENRNAGRRFRCWRCNSSAHTHDACLAKDKKCFGCGKIGHFASACRRKGIRSIQTKEEKRDTPSGWTDDENQSERTRILSFGDVLVNCRLGSSTPICFLIDSGADVNIIGGSDWEVLKREYHQKVAGSYPVRRTNLCLRAHRATKIHYQPRYHFEDRAVICRHETLFTSRSMN
nr:uncharacterized protein LOC115262791 [Aedes albopictus]